MSYFVTSILYLHDLDAMFKLKSLLYKDLILNSRGCRKSNQLLRHPHTVKIFFLSESDWLAEAAENAGLNFSQELQCALKTRLHIGV